MWACAAGMWDGCAFRRRVRQAVRLDLPMNSHPASFRQRLTERCDLRSISAAVPIALRMRKIKPDE